MTPFVKSSNVPVMPNTAKPQVSWSPEQRTQMVLLAREYRIPVRDIAAALDMSTARVYQIIKEAGTDK